MDSQNPKTQQRPEVPAASPDKTPWQRLRDRLRKFSGSFGLLLAAPILALLLTAHVFQPYEVDGQSMETTLQHGDRLIVFKLPKTIANLTGNSYVPGRWDVIVFDRPQRLGNIDNTNHLIKRVIGLPGERVVIKDGGVTVYNEEFPEGFNPDQDQTYASSILSTGGNNVDITVGQNEVFVLGDNRSNSSDSRVFGAVPVSTIVGHATVRFVPANAMKRL